MLQSNRPTPRFPSVLFAIVGTTFFFLSGVTTTLQASSTDGDVYRGKASFYGGYWHGRKTANGETYDQNTLTAAHPTLRFGTKVLVKNLRNGREVTLRINNRGPYVKGRIIDVSKRAAQELRMTNSGVVPVQITVLPKEALTVAAATPEKAPAPSTSNPSEMVPSAAAIPASSIAQSSATISSKPPAPEASTPESQPSSTEVSPMHLARRTPARRLTSGR